MLTNSQWGLGGPQEELSQLERHRMRMSGHQLVYLESAPKDTNTICRDRQYKWNHRNHYKTESATLEKGDGS